MNLEIEGKRALVIGASRGLGAAIARGLLAEGVVVYATGRDPTAIATWSAELPPEQQQRLHATRLDLSDPASVEAAADELLAEGAIDILVNNSGGPPPGPAATATAEQWGQQFQAMAVSLFTLTSRLLPPMIDKGWGRIVTIASSGIEVPIPNLALSNGIRSAIAGWSKTLATEVAPHGITVNLVLPGRIHTDRVDQLDQAAATRQGRTPAEVAAASVATIPAGRYGRPVEFADAVCFLVSNRASYITGSRLRVDGGMIRSQ